MIRASRRSHPAAASPASGRGRVNGVGPLAAGTHAPGCYELGFVWRGARPPPTRPMPTPGGRGDLTPTPGKKRFDDAAPAQPVGRSQRAGAGLGERPDGKADRRRRHGKAN